jgi:hypothetical protein
MRRKRMSKSPVSGDEHRGALAERGVTVVANIIKDRVLVASAKDWDVPFTSVGIAADGARPDGATRLER